MATEWQEPSKAGLYEGKVREGAKEKFVTDFVTAWDKVMNLDRYGLPNHH